MFICGDDDGAKKTVAALCTELGWAGPSTSAGSSARATSSRWRWCGSRLLQDRQGRSRAGDAAEDDGGLGSRGEQPARGLNGLRRGASSLRDRRGEVEADDPGELGPLGQHAEPLQRLRAAGGVVRTSAPSVATAVSGASRSPVSHRERVHRWTSSRVRQRRGHGRHGSRRGSGAPPQAKTRMATETPPRMTASVVAPGLPRMPMLHVARRRSCRYYDRRMSKQLPGTRGRAGSWPTSRPLRAATR